MQTDGVRDEQTEHDGPQHVSDVGYCPMLLPGKGFHPICAYLPSNPTAINSKTPGTYTSRLGLLKMASSEGSVVSTSWVLTASLRNLGQQPSHGQQHHNASHNRGPPINADPP
jgi:hypothetical protein